MEPQIRYVRTSDGVNIAYYAIGNGPRLLIMSPRISTNIEDEWRIPALRSALEATAASFTVVRYDMRGCGLSDRDVGEFSLDGMMRDLEAVANCTAPEPFAIFAAGTSIPVAVAFAATNEHRVTHLVLWAVLRGAKTEALDRLIDLSATDWVLATESFQSAIDGWSSPEDARAYASMMRRSVTPENFIGHERASDSWDVTDLAASVRARALVVHPRDHAYYPTEGARSLAANIPHAQLVLPQGNTVLVPSSGALMAIGEFLSDLSGLRATEISENLAHAGRRSLVRRDHATTGTAVVLFTDIADSTALTETHGDAAFRAAARTLDDQLRTAIRAAGGTTIEGKTLGDGVLAVFTSAANAIDAARKALVISVASELQLHIGLHAGDVIREHDNVYGGAVNIAARICSLCEPGEILVSGTVRELARTSAGVTFDDRGEHALKGIAEPQRVFAVRPRP